MRTRITFIALLLAFFTYTGAITILPEHFGFTDGAIRNFRQGNWDSSTTDLSEGSGKQWNFALPSPGYVYNTYHDVQNVSAFPNANISCSYSQNQNGYFSSGYMYYQNSGQDILNIGYTGAPNTVWNPPIPNGLPHFLGKTWQGDHAYTYGSYHVAGKVISEGTISTHLGSFPALLIRYLYSTSSFSYYVYQWETLEYGITAYALTLNGGMLHVLHQATPNVVATSEALAPSIDHLNIYPNPSNGDFTLGFHLQKASPIQVKIYNLRGQLLHSQSYPALPIGKNSLDIHLFQNAEEPPKPGLYILKIKSDGYIQQTKIIIQ